MGGAGGKKRIKCREVVVGGQRGSGGRAGCTAHTIRDGWRERERARGERGRERERLSLESVKTIMQTDTLEMRCRLPWQQALGWLEVVVVMVGGCVCGGGQRGGDAGKG